MPSVFSKPIPKEARDAFNQVFQQNKFFWVVSVALGTTGLSYWGYHRAHAHDTTQLKARVGGGKRTTKRKSVKTDVNAQFIKNLKRLLRIAIPNVWSKEVGYLIILGFFLVVRTLLSIRIAHVNGTIVRAIVNKRFYRFVARIATLGSIAIPASFVNSWLSFFTSRLALQFRTRLVHHFHDLYLSPLMYYKVSNIDSRINNPDQALTETLTLWGRALSELYSNITKPVLDIVLFSLKLAELMGWEGPGAIFGYYAISLLMIRFISPPFGALAAMSQNLEGNFRSNHHRIITHSEEIAFYNGHEREKEQLNSKYEELAKHQRYVLSQKFGMGAFNGFLQKYGSVMCGYSVLGLPVFGSKSAEYLGTVTNSSDITQDYIRNSSLLINLSKAIGRIVTSYEDVQRLAGYTKMVTELHTVLTDLHNNRYVREMVNPERLAERSLQPGGGERGVSDNIKFNEVSIITPNGDILADKMTFEIEHGQNLMIVGPNGCGKSSLFRMLGGLWPVWDGVLHAPKQADVFYIPQKPYLTQSTLRDQVIYPDSHQQMLVKGWTDEGLGELLNTVKLYYLLDKQGGWEAEKDWLDVLSGGEKQRVAMARVFYHKPKFAILDECTSAVSVDVEGYMYTHCKEIGITLITISHRPSLWKYHELKLSMDGRGKFDIGKMDVPEQYRGDYA